MKLPARYSEKPINLVLDLGLVLVIAFFAARGIAAWTGNDDFISIALLFGTLAFLIACLPLAAAMLVLIAERLRTGRDSRSRSN
jgi:uncharacterized membrane protein